MRKKKERNTKQSKDTDRRNGNTINIQEWGGACFLAMTKTVVTVAVSRHEREQEGGDEMAVMNSGHAVILGSPFHITVAVEWKRAGGCMPSTGY